jgi:hypothetical protein
VSPDLVEEILADRRKFGRFADLKVLEKRIDGIGEVKAQGIAHVVAFNQPRDSQRHTIGDRGELGANLRTLMSLQPDSDPTAAAGRAFDMILTSCSSNPLPQQPN